MWGNLLYNGLPIIACAMIMLFLRWRMNILMLSEEEAHMLGHNAVRIRYAVIFCATVLTVSSVCMESSI